ncbi:MAG: penicillin-binding protein [Alphaproteobacteria bacterium 43-37]|nr:MAG: penicillin-binding protein [Alphaproteobacteria bacterium 43-37]
MSVLATFLIVAITVAVGGLWVFYKFGQDLPDYRQLLNYEPPVVSRLYAADGRLFAEYAVEKRVFVPINAMPKRVVRTFLAAEDKNFYEHPGIDALGIVRAAFNNVFSSRSPMGASTITQQVAKNFFLSNEKSIVRKIKEAILAFRIENTLTKDRILELYLNQIYLGQGSYGVASAALNYFNKALDELTIEEAAYLAALPKAPNNYHPERNHQAAVARRNYVINRMLELGMISLAEGTTAKEKPIVLRARHEASVVQADFFAEEVRREVMAKYGPGSLYEGGLVIKTTLNPVFQQAADESLKNALIAYDRRHGWRGSIKSIQKSIDKTWVDALKEVESPKGLGKWKLAVVTAITEDQASITTQAGDEGKILLEELKWARKCLEGQRLGADIKKPRDVLAVGDVVAVEAIKNSAHFKLCQIPNVGGAIIVLDPHTGRVLAMSGGYSFAMSEFNRATQALRQPGSAFKTFVYLAAFEAGRQPNNIVVDAPLTIDLGPGLPLWKPRNISKRFYGPVTLRTALENSYNISTVRITQDIGIKKVAEVVERLGVIDNMPHQFAMVLGAGETTVKKMATAYATFINGGKKVSMTMIDRIQNRHGQTLFRQDQRGCHSCQNQNWENTDMPVLSDEREQIVNPVNAYQTLSILEGVVKRGTGRKLAKFNRPLAGKTGSTNDYRDAWFIGLTPDLVVAVYVGFDNHKPLGNGEVGGRAAIVAFEDFFEKALAQQKPTPFRIPAGAKLMRVNLKTGHLTSAKDPQAIWECFVPGNEPKFEDSSPKPIGADTILEENKTMRTDQIY